MLTTHSHPDSRDSRSAQINALLTVEGMTLLPEANPVIHRGMMVYFLYETYNVSAAVDANPPPFQMVLWKDGEPVTDARVTGKIYPLPSEQKTRYAAALDTRDLEPGTYTVDFALSSESGETKEGLRKQFEILSRTK